MAYCDEVKSQMGSRLAAPGASPISDLNLCEIALAFPQDVRGRRYILERCDGRRQVGVVQSVLDGSRSNGYLAVRLFDGRELEACLSQDGSLVTCLDRTRPCGELRRQGERTSPSTRLRTWNVFHESSLFGVIQIPATAYWNSLSIRRVDGKPSPQIHLARRPISLWNIVRPIRWFAEFTRNSDLVAPDGGSCPLSEGELALYFLVNLVFRMFLFDLDFAVGG